MSFERADECFVARIGFYFNLQRAECVFPLVPDAPVTNTAQRCQKIATALRDDTYTALLASIPAGVEVKFTEVHSMTPGFIPARIDEVPGALVGTWATGTPIANQVAALGVFYTDDHATSPTGRVRVGKTFLPGISETAVTGDIITSGFKAAFDAWLEKLTDGSIVDTDTFIYRRGVNSSGDPSQAVYRADSFMIRDYVVTQRRRLLPRA